MQQDQQTTGKEQEQQNSAAQQDLKNAQTNNAATQLVPQQGEIKNNDHDLEAGTTSLDHR